MFWVCRAYLWLAFATVTASMKLDVDHSQSAARIVELAAETLQRLTPQMLPVMGDQVKLLGETLQRQAGRDAAIVQPGPKVPEFEQFHFDGESSGVQALTDKISSAIREEGKSQIALLAAGDTSSFKSWAVNTRTRLSKEFTALADPVYNFPALTKVTQKQNASPLAIWLMLGVLSGKGPSYENYFRLDFNGQWGGQMQMYEIDYEDYFKLGYTYDQYKIWAVTYERFNEDEVGMGMRLPFVDAPAELHTSQTKWGASFGFFQEIRYAVSVNWGPTLRNPGFVNALRMRVRWECDFALPEKTFFKGWDWLNWNWIQFIEQRNGWHNQRGLIGLTAGASWGGRVANDPPQYMDIELLPTIRKFPNSHSQSHNRDTVIVTEDKALHNLARQMDDIENFNKDKAHGSLIPGNRGQTEWTKQKWAV